MNARTEGHTHMTTEETQAAVQALVQQLRGEAENVIDWATKKEVVAWARGVVQGTKFAHAWQNSGLPVEDVVGTARAAIQDVAAKAKHDGRLR